MATPDSWYLDANILIDLGDVLAEWAPPAELDKTAEQKRAAARIFFYASPGTLVVSADGRMELTARGAPDWTLALLADIDQLPSSATADEIGERAGKLESAGAKPVDARHLARADLTPWIQAFVTNDRKLRTAASRSDVRADLHVIDSLEAERRLKIQQGSKPTIKPATDNPLRLNQWWLL